MNIIHIAYPAMIFVLRNTNYVRKYVYHMHLPYVFANVSLTVGHDDGSCRCYSENQEGRSESDSDSKT